MLRLNYFQSQDNLVKVFFKLLLNILKLGLVPDYFFHDLR